MKAMILAAGKGTRLGDLTAEVPKPLMPLADGVRIIDVTVERLRQAGIVEIAVNLHHHGRQVQSHLETRYPDLDWRFFPEERLLNTGGGILNARAFLEDSEHFVVSNSDILHFIPVAEAVRAHLESGSRATMVLKPSSAARAVVFCARRGVLGFTNPRGELYYGRGVPEQPFSYGTFCGLQVFHRSIFDAMDGDAFSIVDTYAALIAAGERIHVFDAGDLYWSDLGTPDRLEAGRRVFRASLAAEQVLGEPPAALRSVFRGAGDKEITRVEGKARSVVAVTSAADRELDELDRRSRFLARHGVPVPSVLTRTPGGLVVGDGGRQLLRLLSERDANAGDLLAQAVDILVVLARVPTDTFLELEGAAARAFDRDNVLFDIRYFNRHVISPAPATGSVLEDRSGPALTRFSEQACEHAADIAWSWLDDQPTVLMHRDFQSTNLVVDERGTVRVVDLSTLRTGVSVYDLASLAFDIYLPHREDWLELIVDAFFERFPELDRTAFWGAAWLRLLQATAAAFRFADQRPFFARTIPACFEKLERVMSEPAAAELLTELPPEVVDQVVRLVEA